MSDDLTARIADLVAKELAEREAAAADRGPARRHRPAPRRAANAIDAGRVVTVEDVLRADAAGAALRLPAGAIVTDLAREEAERMASPSSGGASRSVAKRAGPAPAAAHRRRARAADPAPTPARSAAAAKEPAVYRARGARHAGSTAEMIARLDAFTDLVWRSEPQRGARLRQLSRPPMGQLPGIFYACFNLFWLGEEVQTLRDKAKAGASPCARSNELLGTLCAGTPSASPSGTWSTRWSCSATSRTSPRGGRAHARRVPRAVRAPDLAADRIQAWSIA